MTDMTNTENTNTTEIEQTQLPESAPVESMDAQQMQQEIQRLRAHSQQLLMDLKDAKTKLKALQDSAAAGEAALIELKAAEAWDAVYAEAHFEPAAKKSARTLIPWTIALAKDGAPIFASKDGKPIEDMGEAGKKFSNRVRTPTNPEDLRFMVSALRDEFPFLFPVTRGSGAPGSTGNFGRTTPAPAPAPKPAQTKKFGIN